MVRSVKLRIHAIWTDCATWAAVSVSIQVSTDDFAKALVKAAIQFRLWDEDGAEDGRFLGFPAFPVWPRWAGRWSITVSLAETMS